jgi:hypothetical protein
LFVLSSLPVGWVEWKLPVRYGISNNYQFLPCSACHMEHVPENILLPGPCHASISTYQTKGRLFGLFSGMGFAVVVVVVVAAAAAAVSSTRSLPVGPNPLWPPLHSHASLVKTFLPNTGIKPATTAAVLQYWYCTVHSNGTGRQHFLPNTFKVLKIITLNHQQPRQPSWPPSLPAGPPSEPSA